jgi:membrane protein DedA with SNARE-associated domain
MLFGVPMIALTAAGWVGDALAPTLLVSAPLLLIALNPRSRTMLLASPSIELVPFMLVAVVRQLIADPLFFAFGRRYGDVAIEWAHRKAGSASRTLQLLERLFSKASYPAIAIVPNNLICLLAGATAMRWRTFLALNIGGTIVKIALIRAAADQFEGTINSITGWIGDNRLWLTALTIAAVVILVVRNERRDENDFDTIGELEAELAEAQRAVEAHDPN